MTDRREAIKADIAKKLAAAKEVAKTGPKRPQQREVFHPLTRIKR